MSLITADRVKETTTVVGTGTITLLGASTGFQSFATIGNGNTCYYAIASVDGTYWETGIGTYTLSGTTLARTTVLTSSNGGALVNFIAGIKEVFVTYPASKSVFTDSIGCINTADSSPYPTIRPSLNLDFANSKQLDPRITFSRLSTATYYDGQTTAKAEENLLKGSNDFGNSAYWTILATATATSFNAVAPDGTNTASIITFSTNSSSSVYQPVSITAGVPYTLSVWLKGNIGGELVSLRMDLASGSTGIVTKTLTTAWALYTLPNITSVTSGTGNVYLVNYGNAVACTFFASNIQLEQRSSATAYTPTTIQAITNYIPQLMTAPAGVARFDHDPLTGKSLGLLIEESRANLLNYSQTFSLTQTTTEQYWVDTSITRTLSAFIGADGTQSGVQFTATAANAKTIVSVAQGTSAARTLSVFLKRISGTGVINYTLDNGATWIAQAITSTLTRYYFPTTTAAQQVGFQIVSSGNRIGIWGVHLEAGSFATSYIPTTTGSVTRVADQASMTGVNFSSWYNQSEGSLYSVYDVIALNSADYQSIVFLDNLTLTGSSRLQHGVSSGLQRSSITNGTISQLSSSAITANTTHKIASSFTSSTEIAGFDGISQTTVVSGGVMPTGINEAFIGGFNGSTTKFLNGHIKKLAYYPKALTSTELQALTS